MKFASIALLSVSTLLFACSNEANNIAPLALKDIQKQWQLTSIDGKTLETESTLSIDEQAKASGNLGCNNFFGVVELDTNKVRIDKMGSTRKMCEPQVNVIEMSVSSTLSNWSEVSIKDQQLLLTGDKHTLTYSLK